MCCLCDLGGVAFTVTCLVSVVCLTVWLPLCLAFCCGLVCLWWFSLLFVVITVCC